MPKNVNFIIKYLIIRVGFQIKASSLASTQFHVKKWIINLGFGQIDLFVILVFRTASWFVFSVKVNFYQTMFFTDRVVV